MRRWDLIEPGIASILVSLRRCLFDRPEKGLRRRLGLDSADPYVVLCLVVLLGLCLLLALAPQKGAIRQALASIAVLGAAYRFGDILTHHLCSMFVEPKVPRSAIRVLEIAFINFIQAILCFGIGFYFIESWFPDSFAPSSEILGIGQAIYLSLAIMTTVGAGNIYPVTIWGKLLAATAVLTGLILVAFVITRHMAYYAERQKKLVSRTEAAINHVDPRPERDEYLMSVAVDQAARCNCRKTPVGAIIARDDRVISTGYNGTIAGYDNCIDGACPRCADPTVPSGTQLDRCICVHAEENALLAAARFGIRVEGADCWVTNEPCLDCTKQLIQAKLAEVHYWKPYRLPNSESHRLRQEMREHAADETKFLEWAPEKNVLDLEERYRAIKERLDSYVASAQRADA